MTVFEDLPTLGEAAEETNQETADNVDDQCAQRKYARGCEALRPPADQESERRPDESAGADDQDLAQAWANPPYSAARVRS